MADPQKRDMTADEFLIWNLGQDQKYELVGGVPIPLRAMAGASNYHDRIVSNLIGLLYSRLKNSRCWAATADTALRTSIKNVRRPDVTIECAPPSDKHYESKNPIAVFEILSPSTRGLDQTLKFNEYTRHPTLQTIVLIDPERLEVVEYSREPEGWLPVVLLLPEMLVAIKSTAVRLSLAEIYEGVPVPADGEQSG